MLTIVNPIKWNQDPKFNFTSIDNAFSNCIKQYIGWLNATLLSSVGKYSCIYISSSTEVSKFSNSISQGRIEEQ